MFIREGTRSINASGQGRCKPCSPVLCSPLIQHYVSPFGGSVNHGIRPRTFMDMGIVASSGSNPMSENVSHFPPILVSKVCAARNQRSQQTFGH